MYIRHINCYCIPMNHLLNLVDNNNHIYCNPDLSDIVHNYTLLLNHHCPNILVLLRHNNCLVVHILHIPRSAGCNNNLEGILNYHYKGRVYTQNCNWVLHSPAMYSHNTVLAINRRFLLLPNHHNLLLRSILDQYNMIH